MRIKALDGFRAIAVLGVLWAHIWMFFVNPSFKILNVDVAALMSFWGIGVDLFFVISGFCMYLMYMSQTNGFSWRNYLEYIKRRWLRIAPAFYAAIAVYGLVTVNINFQQFDLTYATKQALFVRNYFFESTPYAP